jgi:hypothetical protein
MNFINKTAGICEEMIQVVIKNWLKIYKVFESQEIFKAEMCRMASENTCIKDDIFGSKRIPPQIRKIERFLCGGLLEFVLENLCSQLGLRGIGTDYFTLPNEFNWGMDSKTILENMSVPPESRFYIGILKEGMKRDSNLDLFIRSLAKAAEIHGNQQVPVGNYKNLVEVKIRDLLLED